MAGRVARSVAHGPGTTAPAGHRSRRCTPPCATSARASGTPGAGSMCCKMSSAWPMACVSTGSANNRNWRSAGLSSPTCYCWRWPPNWSAARYWTRPMTWSPRRCANNSGAFALSHSYVQGVSKAALAVGQPGGFRPSACDYPARHLSRWWCRCRERAVERGGYLLARRPGGTAGAMAEQRSRPGLPGKPGSPGPA